MRSESWQVPERLEPGLGAVDVDFVELFVRLGQVDDALNEADNRTNSASKGEDQLDDSFLRNKAPIELSDSELGMFFPEAHRCLQISRQKHISE
ncbi:MAG: hypothetical protein AAGB14_15450, partial [Verrucomicrobiota bacterium]